jgi:hypothetical protein
MEIQDILLLALLLSPRLDNRAGIEMAGLRQNDAGHLGAWEHTRGDEMGNHQPFTKRRQ